MAALKQNSQESESEDGESTYRSLAGTTLTYPLITQLSRANQEIAGLWSV